MTKRQRYARQIRKLFTKLKKEGGKVSLQPVDDPMEQLLRGALSTFASDSRAEAALGRLLGEVVDLNELRVTPIAEMVEIMGAEYPMRRAAAEEISRGLNAVFNHIHGLDLGFLKTSSRRLAESFLGALDGFGPHAKATVMLRCLKGHVIPVDVHMHAFLQRSGCIPEGAGVEDAQKMLTREIKDRDAGSFYVLLKRHAATRVPRKPAAKRPPSTGKAAAKPKTTAKSTAKTESGRTSKAAKRATKKAAAAPHKGKTVSSKKKLSAKKKKVPARRKTSAKKAKKKRAGASERSRSSKARKASTRRRR